MTPVWYLDTSAALKLLVDEPESEALARTLDSRQPRPVASLLLETELRRASQRIPELTQAMVTELLRSIDLYELPPSIFREAGLYPGVSLRSLEALHLAAAGRIGADAIVTYDRNMAAAALAGGMTVVAPA